MTDLRAVNVPKIEEFNFKKHWDQYKTNYNILLYMPNFKENELPERSYFYNVIICFIYIHIISP